MKKTAILAIIALTTLSCTQDNTTDGNVTLKASAVVSNTNLTARTTTDPVVVLTDFKVNIGSIKFEIDVEDERHSEDPTHEDVKLNGPFMLDLLDPNTTLSQIITSLSVPDAQYEEVKFKFTPSLVDGEMLGKSFLIKGTVDGKNFLISSSRESEVEVDFEDASKDFTINSNDLTINLKMSLNGIITRIKTLAGQGLLTDTDNDGVIEITTNSDDNHHDMGEGMRDLLEHETHLED
ncbi:hypothetical protein SAMN05192550_2607 [Flavobacterium glycines]|uniref:DUF4382 domain-containing protein n=1 Tax=Flavobacterium glycines TaxID=551990 RepID=A0A1B9DKW8_9FLAO|nr:hypothetical protein [Flavobacterium glycines]OCB70283.1 hypothetical protein FBGL_11990 [Flavobacterium glycines]GEL11679.1 hypothetical protein FGL01_24180 [Flavobacterium glycines]SDJ70544.1 hypothetical protein SAMN05192550_2607 [Flavobacterium glycines]